MSQAIGSLLVEIAANTARFASDMDRVATIANNKMAEVDRAAKMARRGMELLGTYLSVDAIVGKWNSVVQSMSALDDAADKTGVSVEKLSAMLNTLAPSGVGLEQITDIAGKLVKAMQGVDDENKKSAEAFEKLGIRTKDASGNLRGVDEVMEEVARTLDQYEDGANKTALAQALFGKSGAAALPILKDLVENHKMAASVTTEQARAAEELEKALGRLKVQTEAIWQSLASGIIPQITKLIEQFEKGKEAAGGFWSALMRYGLTMPGDPAAKIAETIKKLDDLQKDLDRQKEPALGYTGRGARGAAEKRRATIQAEIDQTRKDLEYYQLLFRQTLNDPKNPFDPDPRKPPAPRIGSDGGGTSKQLTDAERLYKQLMDRIYATQKLTEEQKILLDVSRGELKFKSDAEQAAAVAAARQLDALNVAEEVAKREKEFAEQQEDVNRRAAEGVRRFIEDQKRKAQSWIELIDPAEKYRRQIEEINAIEDAYLSQDQKTQARGRVLAEQFEQQNIMRDQIKQQDDLGKQLGNTWESMFERAVISGQRFSDVLKGLGQDIMRLILRQQVSSPIANWLSGLFTSQASFNGYITGGLARGSVWSGMDGAASDLMTPKSAVRIDMRNTFTGGADPVTMATWSEQTKNATLQAVAEQQRRR